MGGESLFDHKIDSDTTAEPDLRLAALSPQEQVLANHLADGLTNRQIAERMDLAEKTVKNYVSNALTKLGMARRSEAAAFVARVQAVSAPVTAGDSERSEEAQRPIAGKRAP
jgi:DNA-binding NarL/FixJ family response regulator